MPQPVGVVLAGGLGTRYGSPKGTVLWHGKTLAERAAAALRPQCGSVLISIAPESTLRVEGYDHVVDALPEGRGPLAGLAAAYEASAGSDLLVLACDYPLVDAPWLGALLDAGRTDADLVMPTEPRGVDHPLVGLWRRTAQPAVVAALAENRRRVRSVLPDLDVHRVPAAVLPAPPWPEERLRNVNRPEDWEGIGEHEAAADEAPG